jgi:hypothetical protein
VEKYLHVQILTVLKKIYLCLGFGFEGAFRTTELKGNPVKHPPDVSPELFPQL